MSAPRWRTGGEFELTTLLDKEAFFLRIKNPTQLVLLKLGETEREIEEFLARAEVHTELHEEL